VDDVGSAAVRFLLGISAVTSQLGVFSPSDPVSANQNVPWIFDNDILVDIQNTGAAALVCSTAGNWSAPIPNGTARFMRLSVEFYVAPQRDANLNVTETPGVTINRGEALFALVNSFLHRRDSDTQVWGDLVTDGCQLLAEGQFVKMPTGDGDWMQYKQSFYGVGATGWTDAAI
jgi:hypothetical protein